MADRRWPEGVVFDLDGTLVDSVGDIACALNSALAEHGVATLTADDVRNMVGRGAEVTIARALARQQAEDRDVHAIHEAFVRHYAAAPAARTVLYPAVAEVLALFRSEGRRLAICTNKPQGLTDEIVETLGVGGHFGASVGASDLHPRKPHPAMLKAAFDGIGIAPSAGVMIGDSTTDVDTARALGVPIILVSFGYTPVPARELGADAVIDHYSELPTTLARMSAHRS